MFGDWSSRKGEPAIKAFLVKILDRVNSHDKIIVRYIYVKLKKVHLGAPQVFYYTSRSVVLRYSERDLDFRDRLALRVRSGID